MDFLSNLPSPNPPLAPAPLPPQLISLQDFKISNIVRNSTLQPSLFNTLQFQKHGCSQSSSFLLYNATPNSVNLTSYNTTYNSNSNAVNDPACCRTQTIKFEHSHNKRTPQISAFEQTHSSTAFLVSRSCNNKVEGEMASKLEYVSSHDNKVVRLFPGITGQINTISLSPTSDFFLTTDHETDHSNSQATGTASVKIWDVNCAGCQGRGTIESTRDGKCLGCVKFDPSGGVFAAGYMVDDDNGTSSSENVAVVKLYDVRKFNAAFSTFIVNESHIKTALGDVDYATLLSTNTANAVTATTTTRPFLSHGQLFDFNPTGTTLLLRHPSKGTLVLFDAYSGDILQVYSQHLKLNNINNNSNGAPRQITHPGVSCFSADGRSILSGCSDGSIVVYHIPAVGKEAGNEIVETLGAKHAEGVRGIAICKEWGVVASACANVAMWMEDI